MGNLTRIISYPARYWARTVRRICSLSCSFGGETVTSAPRFLPVGIFSWGMSVNDESDRGIIATTSPTLRPCSFTQSFGRETVSLAPPVICSFRNSTEFNFAPLLTHTDIFMATIYSARHLLIRTQLAALWKIVAYGVSCTA